MHLIWLLKSGFLGVITYFMLGLFIGLGDESPTLDTPYIYWLLIAIGILVWLVSYMDYMEKDK